MMELQEAIRTRRSVKVYADKPVEREKILKVIEAGNRAPSACNIQGWRFLVVEDKSHRDSLVEKGVIHLKNIPVGIFVLYYNKTNNTEYADYVQSASAAIQNMLLTAHDMGLGACWICHLPKKDVLRRLLKVPGHYDPIALVTLGYPSQPEREVPRKADAKDLVCYEEFGFDISDPKGQIRKSLKKVHEKLPGPLKKITRGIYEKK